MSEVSCARPNIEHFSKDERIKCIHTVEATTDPRNASQKPAADNIVWLGIIVSLYILQV